MGGMINVYSPLCADIARVTGEKVSVVDLVLWRFATLDSNYLECLIDVRK
jgi:hypothetical protein